MPLPQTSHSSSARPFSSPDQASAWLIEKGAGELLLAADGSLLEYNRAAATMFRLPALLTAQSIDLRQFCREPEKFVEMVRGLQANGHIENWDGDFVAFDGSPLHAVVNLVGNFNTQRELQSIRAQIFNITEWRRGHERAEFGQRLETVGKLAGNIAHDFNNILAVIGGHSEILTEALPLDSPLRRSIAAIQESSARAAKLTQKLLTFGRQQSLSPTLIDPGRLVVNVEGDVRRNHGRRIDIGLDIRQQLWPVRVDAERTENAIATIAGYAIEAMPDGGSLTLRATNIDVGPHDPQVYSFVRKGRYVRIDVVCDRAILDEDSSLSAFEPFLRDRRAAREGTGLAEVFTLVKQSGGYMWIGTEPSMPTAVTILLPAEVSTPRTTTTAAKLAAHKPATILVVESDDEIRRLVAKILRHGGDTVLEAASAGEAFHTAESQSIDLLIADASAAPMMLDWPKAKFLCVSGHGAAGEVEGADATRTSVLEKPFSARQLVARVRELLG